MAKREVSELGNRDEQVVEKTSSLSKARELKKELRRLVKEIIRDGDDDEIKDIKDDEGCDNFKVDTVDRLIQTLRSLKELKLNHQGRSFDSQLKNLEVPDQFLCPISKELMRDPVILSTGQTYDRVFIEALLKSGVRTCPRTDQVLSHTVLTPNHLVRELIAGWCKDHGVELPPPVADPDEGAITDADRGRLESLLLKLSSCVSDQKKAAKELRTLTKKMPSFRSLFGESTDTLTQLLTPLQPGTPDPDLILQEDLITVILNLSIPEKNKSIVAEHPLVIPRLIEFLSHGTIETRRNAAAALFTLAVIESNQVIMAQAGAIGPLIGLLAENHTLAMQDAACALYKLCTNVEIREKVIQEGAVIVIMTKIKDRVLVDELLVLLALLSPHDKAITEMMDHGAVGCLLSVIREERPAKTKENSVATLYAIIARHKRALKEIKEDEMVYGTLCILENHGNERAKRKAKSILNRLDRCSLSHTA